jgi:hypothetical protein
VRPFLSERDFAKPTTSITIPARAAYPHAFNLVLATPQACRGVVRNCCVSVPRGTVLKRSAAPLPPFDGALERQPQPVEQPDEQREAVARVSARSWSWQALQSWGMRPSPGLSQHT